MVKKQQLTHVLIFISVVLLAATSYLFLQNTDFQKHLKLSEKENADLNVNLTIAQNELKTEKQTNIELTKKVDETTRAYEDINSQLARAKNDSEQKEKLIERVCSEPSVLCLNLETDEVPFSAFINKLVERKRVSIIMDIRGADDAAGENIVRCGASLAGSPMFNGMDLTNYACDEQGCLTSRIGSQSTTAVPLSEMKNKLEGRSVLHVAYGPSKTTFYSDIAEISIDSNYGGSCNLEVK